MERLWELTIITAPALEETCLWRLEDWDALGVAAETREGVLAVRAFFQDEPPSSIVTDLQKDLSQDAATFDLPAPALKVQAIPREDWATQWMRFWRPRAVGTRFWICPLWLVDELSAEGRERVVLKLDVGLAFGTGEHETSRLCLEALESCLQPGDQVADIGCGSGILTIGALLLGAGSAQAVDLEEQAVRATQQNLEHNGLSAIVREGSVEAVQGPVTGILCNILASVILELLPKLHALLQPSGWAILSGTLTSQVPQVTAALGNNWTVEGVRTEGQWAALTVRRN
ncbi:50S ribosomal protein L11 methyltransferase [Anthocerotibacter panamensis]|uniref:50S ribosomal protein L11 methyltransferase n=1 Tax=Anthocerotibacter panamensis TaxID=2857077 RepID=UPI001C405DE3|nr:50S ribosomal protein L11 methyltransferase [Anthocerotibacter panamensis]